MIKCLIVDDEPLARDILESYVSESGELRLVKSCKDASEAMQVLKEQEIDLLFLDINMPKISGLNFYKTLVNQPKVIFTTAYAEHALEGFELEAVDYLLKPFSFERFRKAVLKAQQVLSDKSTEFIMLKVDRKTHKVNFSEILFFESIGDYVKLHMVNEQVLIINETLKKLEELLPPSQFMRVHKSYLMAIDHLEYIEGNQMKVGLHKLPVGQSYRDKVNEVFKKN